MADHDLARWECAGRLIAAHRDGPVDLRLPLRDHDWFALWRIDMDTQGTYGHEVQGDMQRAAGMVDSSFAFLQAAKK